MDSSLGSVVSNPLWDFNIYPLEICKFFDFGPWAEQIDEDIRTVDHFLDLLVVPVIHGVINNSFILDMIGRYVLLRMSSTTSDALSGGNGIRDSLAA